MKKILFTAFAATLFAASCQKTEIVGTTPVNGPAMTFSTEMKKITKADPTADAEEDENLHAQGFYVWAYADFDVTNASNVDKTTNSETYLIYDNMNGMKLTYSNSNWSAPENMEYYWPGTDKSLRFFAISAKENTKGKAKVTNGIGSGTPSIEISNFEVTDGNEDLMVADFRKQHQRQDERVVHLDFHHTLTKVEFKFKTNVIEGQENPKVFVQELKLTNINNKGTLTASPTTNFATTPTSSDEAEVLEVGFVWTPSDGASKTFTSNGPKTLDDEDKLPEMIIDINGNEISTTGSNKAPLLKATAETYQTWLMLPHNKLTKEQLIEIKYVIDDRQFVAKFPLAGEKDGTAQISSWDVNQYITYTINLSPNLISFEASSNDWNPTTGEDVEMNN